MDLRFDQGSLIIRETKVRLDDIARFDPRINAWRSFAMHFPTLIKRANSIKESVTSDFHPFPHLRGFSRPQTKLSEIRDYQLETVEAWKAQKGRGTVVLPTGAGKTRVAVEIIERTARPTLVVVPTLELLAQWYGILSEAFTLPIGRIGGGEHDVREVTVTTYDSAYRWMDRYGDRFALLVFDEVHHLPAPSFGQIAQMSVAPFRLGLTATLERVDFRHTLLERWVGDIVYRKTIEDFSGSTLAPYRTVRRRVRLTDEESKTYERFHQEYLQYVRKRGFRGKKAFDDLLREASTDSGARRAVASYHHARRVLSEASGKLDIVYEILRTYSRQKILIFTEFNDMAYRISSEYFIPAITHMTSPRERRSILADFSAGHLRAIVTSKVLNEGVDVPTAEVALVLGGSGSRREHVQRLGRILRPLPGKEALLIEVVTKEERSVSYRRRNDAAFRTKPKSRQPSIFGHAYD